MPSNDGLPIQAAPVPSVSTSWEPEQRPTHFQGVSVLSPGRDTTHTHCDWRGSTPTAYLSGPPGYASTPVVSARCCTDQAKPCLFGCLPSAPMAGQATPRLIDISGFRFFPLGLALRPTTPSLDRRTNLFAFAAACIPGGELCITAVPLSVETARWRMPAPLAVWPSRLLPDGGTPASERPLAAAPPPAAKAPVQCAHAGQQCKPNQESKSLLLPPSPEADTP